MGIRETLENMNYCINSSKPLWFAIQENDNDDAWEIGSYDPDKAIKIAIEYGARHIAVIDKDTNQCVGSVILDAVSLNDYITTYGA